VQLAEDLQIILKLSNKNNILDKTTQMSEYIFEAKSLADNLYIFFHYY